MEPALLGSVLLWGAVAVALLSLVPRLSRLLGLAAVLATLSTVSLAWGLLADDFSLSYVVKTSSLATPWPYKLAALWGGMEGSMLFYAAMTTVVAWAGLRRHPAARVGSAIGAALLLFTAVFANPFSQLDIPAVDGQGLLALLQHPAMIYHPPILYLGLTTLVVPFALAVQGVWSGELGTAWLDRVRLWLLVSWTLLTVGMVAGANWAYVELGWGGFWAWDPVENTALMPWLAATVFLHTSRVHERDGRMRRWSVTLAALPFALTVLGIYLTRSGATGSIHAFAEDPVIGRILLVAAVLFGVAVIVLAVRSPKGERWERFGLGRDTWLGTSGMLVSVVLVFVTVGSAYPAYVQVFAGEEVSVGSRFFVGSIYPIAVIIALLVGLAFKTTWSTHRITRRDIVFMVGVAGLTAAVALVLSGDRWVPIGLLAVSVAALALLLVALARTRPGGHILAGHLAHLGLAMVLIGAAGSSLGGEFSGVMTTGDSIEVSGKTVVLESIEPGEADRFIFVRADFTVDGKRVAPEIRAYEDQPLPVAEPALVTGPPGDVVIAISTVAANADSVSVSVFVRPMVWWVWAGALVMALAGGFALAATASTSGAPRPTATARQRSTERAT